MLRPRWPALIWALALLPVLLAYRFLHTNSVFELWGNHVYGSDLLLCLLLVAALGGQIRPLRATRPGRITWVASAGFCLIVGIEFIRSILDLGLSDAMQARHLSPLLLVCVLPLSSRFQSLKVGTLANVMSIALLALGIRSLVRLATGYSTTTILGVERIYQTWEPFLAAALGLALIAFILVAERPSALHYLGVVASLLPVTFSFFRTAWVLMALIALLMLVLLRARNGRRIRLLAAAAAFGATVVIVGAIPGGGSQGPHGAKGSDGVQAGTASEKAQIAQRSYGSQITKRLGEISPTLDPYRSKELSAVQDQIAEEPVIGSGFGTNYVGRWSTHPSFAHNAYQWLWWRLGIVGLGVFLIILGSAAAAGLEAFRKLTDDERGMAAGLVAALTFTALAAFVHENFETYQSNLVVALILSQLIVFSAHVKRSEPSA